MKKHKPVETVYRTIKGHSVKIEIYHSRFGYHGRWISLSSGETTGSSTYQPTIELAIAVNANNAFAGLREIDTDPE